MCSQKWFPMAILVISDGVKSKEKNRGEAVRMVAAPLTHHVMHTPLSVMKNGHWEHGKEGIGNVVGSCVLQFYVVNVLQLVPNTYASFPYFLKGVVHSFFLSAGNLA